MPEVKLYSGEKRTPYNDFTIDFCKEQAFKIFTDRLTDVIKQCGGEI